ncbi:hypothetical protein [Dinghuibacter silviterrae]|uniref:Uncharacterized protein n=1 Tax=Dinghuibacter silviterrae TaxID=1539049 RepID=A0A4R8DHH3_9BACT|nr:hypothetical protein [Dinghuibacter silviterrae]TDW96967.1 hypothetical protein EDB95_4803 [Dinghuibacter silviterrae]
MSSSKINSNSAPELQHSPEAQEIIIRRPPLLLRLGTLLVTLGVGLLLWVGWTLRYTDTAQGVFVVSTCAGDTVTGRFLFSASLQPGQEVTLGGRFKGKILSVAPGNRVTLIGSFPIAAGAQVSAEVVTGYARLSDHFFRR